MVPLTRAIGPKRAMQMLLTGDLIDASTAVEWGLVNQAVPREDLDATVDALAHKIADASSMVLALGKRTFYEQTGLQQADAYRLAAKVMTENAATDDAHEGISAFLEKRRPTWTGR
jgi:enoyl-CoA hydratase/carnithine racemase